MDQGILDEVLERTGQRILIAAHDRVIDSRQPDPAAPLLFRRRSVSAHDSAHDLPHVDLAGRGDPGVGPLERQQIVDQPGQPAGVRCNSSSTSGSAPCRAMNSTLPSSVVTGVLSSWEASARNRRSPARAASSEASIRVEHAGQLADLIRRSARRQPLRGIGRPLDLAGAGRQSAQRTQASPGQCRGEQRRQQRRTDADQDHEQADMRGRVRDV